MHHRLPAFLPALVFTLALAAGPALGQTVEVQNGATVQAQNGAVLDLEGGQMDLGGVGATATLDETGAGRVTGGTLTATRALDAPDGADPAGLGAVIDASVNLGDVTITRGHTVQTGGGNQGLARYYEIVPSQNNSGLDATLTHTYHDDELNGLAESDLVLFSSTDGGTSWTRKGADSRSTGPTGGNTVTLSGVASFSRWTLGSDSSPLPVEMTGFEGTATEDGVQLRWQTASETNNAGFRVERRLSEGGGPRTEGGGGWAAVATVESKAEGGVSSEALTYTATDANVPFTAESLAYRLVQIDRDGTERPIAEKTVEVGGPAEFTLHGSFPNPMRSQTTIRYELPEEREVTVAVYDARGRKVRTLVASEEQKGRQDVTFAAESLASGVYFYRIRAGDYTEMRKLVLVR